LDGISRAAMVGDESFLLAGEFVRILVQVEDAIRETGPRQEARQDGREDNGDEENKTKRFHFSE